MNNEIKVLKIGASDDSYVVTKLYFKDFDKVNVGDIVISYESSKADFDLESEFEGYIKYMYNVGDKISVGDVLAIVHKTKDSFFESSPPKVNNLNLNSTSDIIVSDKAVELLISHGLQPSEIGKKTIKEKDVLDYLSKNIPCLDVNFDKPKFYERTEIKLNGTSIKCFSNKISNNVVFGKNIIIECESLVLGKNVIIGDNVLIKGKKVVIDDYSRIGSNTVVTYGLYDGNLLVGKRCMIGSNSYLNIEKDVILQDDVCVSSDVKLITHRQWHSLFLGGESFFSGITLKNNSFIGPGTIIMPGITVGEWTTVIANSSVLQNLEPKILAGGVPAIKIKDLNIGRVKLSLDDKLLILHSCLEKFNLMVFNYFWNIEKTSINNQFKFSNNKINSNFHLSIFPNSNHLNSSFSNHIVILLEGNLPDKFEGIEIENHFLKISDNVIKNFLYNSFFLCGVHLKCD